MLFLSAAVLLIGLGRWYVGLTSRRGADAAESADTGTAKTAKATPVAGLCHLSQRNFPDSFSANPPPRRPAGTGRPGRKRRPMPAATAPIRSAISPPPGRRRARHRGSGGGRNGLRATSRGTQAHQTFRGTTPRPSRATDGDLGSELDGAMPERPRRPRPRARRNPEPANLAGGYGPSRANRASSHRRSGVSVRRRSTPRVSARSGSAADSTTISRSRIRSTRRRGRVARRTIRCRACATAELTTRTAGWSTARGPGHRRAQPPGPSLLGLRRLIEA